MHASDKPRLHIRAIRESRGYTQEYMAEMLDICQSTYANLESGRTQEARPRKCAFSYGAAPFAFSGHERPL
jgi:DNA-binding XRE family transcriptional regulator